MANEFEMTIDYTEFNKAIERELNLGNVRKRDISKVYRDANRPLIKVAKSIAGKSKRGAYSLQYTSRNHTAGALRRGVKFKTSKRYKLVYYVLSTVWYSAIYASQNQVKRRYKGNPFMERAWNMEQGIIKDNIFSGLKRIIEREWKNG